MHHGLKALLDKANYEAFQVITNMHEKIGRDPALAEYLKDVYPNPIMESYQLMYGDPNVEIVKSRFINETQCVSTGGTNVTNSLKQYMANTNLKEKGTTAAGVPTADRLPMASVAPSAGKFARNIEEATYCGVLLDTIDIKWPYANPLFMFEDLYVTRHLEDVNYRWTFDSKSYTLKDKPKITMALQFYGYIYTRKVHQRGSDNSVPHSRTLKKRFTIQQQGPGEFLGAGSVINDLQLI